MRSRWTESCAETRLDPIQVRKSDQTEGYVAPKAKACKVRIGSQNSSVLTRRATPTQIATASTNAVLAELQPTKSAAVPEKTGPNFQLKTACQPQRGTAKVLTGDQCIAALEERRNFEADEIVRKENKVAERERKKMKRFSKK